MDIKNLIYFKTIVEEGTISKAAKVLHMTQPPLSMQLKQMEEELGIQLIIRGRKKIELTHEGKVLYKRALQMINLYDLTYHELKNTQNEYLRIGITSSNHALLKNQKMQNYFSSNPSLSMRIHEGTTYEMIDLLQTHNIDIAIVRTPFDESQFTCFHLKPEPMVVVASHQYDLSHDSILDYMNMPIIIHQRYLPLINDYCINHHQKLNIHITTDDCRTSLLWSSLNQGIAIIPKSAVDLISDDNLHYIELKNKELYTNAALITRINEPIDQKINEFIELFH